MSGCRLKKTTLFLIATTTMVFASVMPLIRNLGENTVSSALLLGIPTGY
jgi:hypothetical protein